MQQSLKKYQNAFIVDYEQICACETRKPSLVFAMRLILLSLF